MLEYCQVSDFTMKHKKHNTSDKKAQAPITSMDGPIFSIEAQAEIDRLAAQKDEDLAPLAFRRLQEIKTEQQPQVERNKKIESWRLKNQNRYTKIAVAVGGVGIIGLVADNQDILAGALLGSLLNVGLHAKWVAAQAVGFDYVPFKGAEQRVEYIDNILQSHPVLLEK